MTHRKSTGQGQKVRWSINRGALGSVLDPVHFLGHLGGSECPFNKFNGEHLYMAGRPCSMM